MSTPRDTYRVDTPTRYVAGPKNNPRPRLKTEWLTQNEVRRLSGRHWSVLNKRVATLKTSAMLTAMPRPAHPFQVRVRVTAQPYKKSRAFDADAIAPHVKACLDGLVLAGVLTDDSPEHVAGVLYLPPLKPAPGEPDHLILTLEPETS